MLRSTDIGFMTTFLKQLSYPFWSLPLNGASLHGSILHGATLHGCILYEAILHGAILHGTILHGAILHGATLHGAILHGAILHGAILHEYILHGAILHGAFLHGYILHGAFLHGAILHNRNCLPILKIHETLIICFGAFEISTAIFTNACKYACGLREIAWFQCLYNPSDEPSRRYYIFSSKQVNNPLIKGMVCQFLNTIP